MKRIVSIILLALLLVSCEKEFVPDVIPSDEIVVEGYIEAGSGVPPYVILTKNIPFFKELNASQLANLFVRNAEVSISNGTKTVQLLPICWQNLTPSEKKTVGLLIGINPDSVSTAFDFCAYLDISNTFVPKAGDRYDLTVKAEGKVLTATTTIPTRVPLDSSIFIQPPGNKGDTVAQLRAWIKDPTNEKNYYGYFTSTNGGSYVRGANSVIDDAFFNGQDFKFNLFKSEKRNPDNPDAYGLFFIGDTISIKWCTIDKAHFEFWNTLEFNANNQGPFSTYTRIKSNINGGIGVWGGQNVTFLDKIVKK